MLGGAARYSATDAGYGVRLLAEALREAPKALRPQLRKALATSGSTMRQAAAANASWSRRIPKSLVVRTKFSGARPGVYIIARRSVAPHARPIEGITGVDKFRHPLFGDTEHWYDQPTRPFLAKAVEDKGDAAIREIQDGLEAALRSVGLK